MFRIATGCPLLFLCWFGHTQALVADAIKYDPSELPSTQVRLGVDETVANCSAFNSFTALGDSFSAGFGSLQRLRLCNWAEKSNSPDCTAEACGKDTGSYGYRFAKKYNIRNFQYLPCSGNDTWSIYQWQIDKPVFGTPNVVTINAGGDNNNAFFNVVIKCMFNLFNYSEQECLQAIQSANRTINEPGVGGLTSAYDYLFKNLRSKVPSAIIVVMGYLRFWDNIGNPNCEWPLNFASSAAKLQMNQLVTDINFKLANVSKYYNLVYVDADPYFAGHRLCSSLGNNSFTSWFQMFPAASNDTAGEPYVETSVAHPTFNGQNAYLQVLERALGC